MTEWQADAGCRDRPTSWWFPDLEQDDTEQAVAICRSCPVRNDCLLHAVTKGEWTGIWGALTPSQRSEWAKAQRLPRHGTLTGYTGDGCRCDLCRTEISEYDRSKRPRKKESRKVAA
jgi:WhiB family transcriptional regulator, redox-sensing transcriptional regulator